MQYFEVYEDFIAIGCSPEEAEKLAREFMESKNNEITWD